MVNKLNMIDRFKPKSKEQRPVDLISLIHTYVLYSSVKGFT